MTPQALTSSSMLLFISCFITLILFSYVITLVYRQYALRQGVIDSPNERSSHTAPTPRGGGISIIISFCMILIGSHCMNWLSLDALCALLIGGGTVAIVGLIDDHKPLASSIRFGAHLLASLAALLILNQPPELPLFNTTLLLSGVLLIPTALALTWLINLYNFMDGIDGIAAIEAISVLLGATLISFYSHSQGYQLLLLLCAPLLGFLILNWSPAKIFMGDGCSGFLGIILGLLGAVYATHSALNLWCWLILLGVFITDASWTLLTRIATKQKWHQPHRSHAYQILSRRVNSHSKVSLGTGAINLFWLTPIAILASQQPTYGVIYLIIAYAPLLVLCARQKAGLKN